jgi:integrase/recombinase XerD
MELLQSLEGFLLHKRIEGLSPRTLAGYERQIEHLAGYLGNPPTRDVSTDDLRRFLDYLRNEYTPQRLTGGTQPLSAQTIRNYWIALRSFWTWASAEFGVNDVAQHIPAPKTTQAVTSPLSRDEVDAMFRACMTTRDGRRHPCAHRNAAILSTLLDTGMRVSELCSLTIGDYDPDRGKLYISNGKGAKRRVVYVGQQGRKRIWRYLVKRENRDNNSAPLFASTGGTRPISRSWVRKLVANIGQRAGVRGAHPHRCRYTFAIEYLRNSGDIFTLQRILGHSSLGMVRHYLALADVDAERVHKTASPLDNWGL